MQVSEVVPGGPCDGHLLVGDVITHVDAESVVGKDPAAVVELCSNSLRVILDIEREGLFGDVLYSFTWLLL